MSATARHRREAEAEAAALAKAMIARLQETTEPEHILFQRLYDLVRARQKLAFSVKEATGRLRARERHVNALLNSMANVHDQLVDVIAERDRLRAGAEVRS